MTNVSLQYRMFEGDNVRDDVKISAIFQRIFITSMVRLTPQAVRTFRLVVPSHRSFPANKGRFYEARTTLLIVANPIISHVLTSRAASPRFSDSTSRSMPAIRLDLFTAASLPFVEFPFNYTVKQ